jgi:hypothetical protein
MDRAELRRRLIKAEREWASLGSAQPDDEPGPFAVIATFGPTTAWEGKTISYEEGQFILEGYGAITAADVLEYDRQTTLQWPSIQARDHVFRRSRGYFEFPGDVEVVERAVALCDTALWEEQLYRIVVLEALMDPTSKGDIKRPYRKEVKESTSILVGCVQSAQSSLASARAFFAEHGMSWSAAEARYPALRRALAQMGELAHAASASELHEALEARLFGPE